MTHPWSWTTPFEHPTLNGDFTNEVSAAFVNTVVDSAGNQYVAGVFRGAVSFGGTVLTSHTVTPYACDLYVAKLSPQGQWLWAVNAGGIPPAIIAYGSNTGIRADAIGLDAQGNVYVAGAFRGDITFGTTTLRSGTPNFLDAYVVKLSPSGQWLRAVAGLVTGGISGPFNGIGIKSRLTMTVSPTGDAYLSGIYAGIMRFGQHQLPDPGGAAGFLARLSTTGQWRWAMVGGQPNPAAPLTNDGVWFTHLAMDPQGRLVAAGSYMTDSATLGGYPIPAPPGQWVNDLFVARLDSGGQWLSVAVGGGTGSDWVTGLTVDAAGNAYMAGRSQFSLAAFGTDTVLGSGNAPNGIYEPAAFLAKLTTANTWAWARVGAYENITFGGQNSLYSLTAGQVKRLDLNGQLLSTLSSLVPATTLAAAPAGQIAVAGPLQGSAFFGASPLSAAPDFGAVFAARLAATDQWLWAAQAQAGGALYLNDLIADAQGNTYATGALTGTVAVGSSVVATTGTTDLIVVKLDRRGQPLWARQAGAARAAGGAITIDQQGDCWIYGWADDTIRLAGQAVRGGFLTRLSAQGQWQWMVPAPSGVVDQPFATPYASYGGFNNRRLAVDPAGHFWLGGVITPWDTIRLANQQWISRGGYDGYLAHYSPSGQLINFEQLGGPADDRVTSVATDARGNVYVSGYFRRTLSFGSLPLTAHDSLDADGFVARRNQQGWLWAQRIGDQQEDVVSALAVEPAGRFLVAAVNVATPTGFGSTQLPAAGGFVVRLDSLGLVQWASELKGTGNKYIASLNLDAQGNAFAHGNVMGGSVRFGTDSIVGNRLVPPQPVQAGFLAQHRGQGGPPAPTYTAFLGALSAGGQWLWGTPEVGVAVAASGNGDVFTCNYMGTELVTSFGPLHLPPVAHGVGLVAGMLGAITATAADASTPNRLEIWPNPAFRSVRLTGAPIGPVTILDGLGRSVKALTTTSTDVVLDLTGLPPGLYLVRAGSQTQQLVVQP